jgi:hypothetical protein
MILAMLTLIYHAISKTVRIFCFVAFAPSRRSGNPLRGPSQNGIPEFTQTHTHIHTHTHTYTHTHTHTLTDTQFNSIQSEFPNHYSITMKTTALSIQGIAIAITIAIAIVNSVVHAAAAAAAAGAGSVILGENNFTSYVTGSPLTLVLFYAPW